MVGVVGGDLLQGRVDIGGSPPTMKPATINSTAATPLRGRSCFALMFLLALGSGVETRLSLHPPVQAAKADRAAALRGEAAGELDEQTDAVAAGVIAGVLATHVPGGAGDVDVGPGRLVDELLEEGAGVDRSRLALLRGVGRGRRPCPWSAPCTRDGAAGARPARPSARRPSIDLARPARRRWRSPPRRSSRARPARRRSGSPGRRSARRRARPRRPSASARIRRPSASVLLTSTVLPLCWRDDVAGLDAVPARHVLGRGDHGDESQPGGPVRRSRPPPRARPRRRTCPSSSPASRRGLDRDAAGVEGDALADEAHRRRRRPRRYSGARSAAAPSLPWATPPARPSPWRAISSRPSTSGSDRLVGAEAISRARRAR